MSVIVTGCGGSAAYNFIDSLKLASSATEVVGVDTSSDMIELSNADSKHVIQYGNFEGFAQEINQLVSRYSATVVFAQPDNEVELLARARHLIDARTFLPETEEILLAKDKAKLGALLRKEGVQVPKSFSVENPQQLNEGFSQLTVSNGKVWVRAKSGAGSRASLPCSSSDQAESWIKWWVEERNLEWSDFMVSEFLPGREFALQTIWQNGKLIAAQARERIKYLYGFLSPSGQSSTPQIAATTSRQDVYEVGIKAINALSDSPNGVYCVDMKCDREDQPKVTEINVGRFFTTSNFFSHAGLNMPEMARRAAEGEELQVVGIAPLKEGLKWIRMVDMGWKLVQRS